MTGDPGKALAELFAVLGQHWYEIDGSWRREVARISPPDGNEAVELLSRMNVGAFREELARGETARYLACLRGVGEALAKAQVPFHLLMLSLHLYEERCGDALRPELSQRPILWEGLSALDRIIHSGIASLAEGYFRALSDQQKCEMLEHVRDTAATLSHRINNPLASVTGTIELMLAERTLTEVTRERLLRVQASAQRIEEALSELVGGTNFARTPYLSEIHILAPVPSRER